MVLRTYFWFCTQGSFLFGFGGPFVVLVIEPGSATKQASTLSAIQPKSDLKCEILSNSSQNIDHILFPPLACPPLVPSKISMFKTQSLKFMISCRNLFNYWFMVLAQVFNSVIRTNYSKPEIIHSNSPFGERNRMLCWKTETSWGSPTNKFPPTPFSKPMLCHAKLPSEVSYFSLKSLNSKSLSR